MRVTMMRNIETFPSKQMYPYLPLVERKVADFYLNIDRKRWLVWLKWLIFITFSGQLMVSLHLLTKQSYWIKLNVNQRGRSHCGNSNCRSWDPCCNPRLQYSPGCCYFVVLMLLFLQYSPGWCYFVVNVVVITMHLMLLIMLLLQCFSCC